MPFAMNLVRLCVIVLARIAKLFRVVCLRLACTKGIGYGQHDSVGLLEIPFLPRWFSAQSVLGILLRFGPCNYSIHAIVCGQSSCHCLRRLFRFDLNGSSNMRRVLLRQADDREPVSAQAKGGTIGMLWVMEDLRRNQLRPLQSAGLPVFASTRCIPCERESKPKKQSRQRAPQGGVQKIGEPLFPVNPLPQELMHLRVV